MFYLIVTRRPGELNDEWCFTDEKPEELNEHESLIESQSGFSQISQPDTWVNGYFRKGGRWVHNKDDGGCVASASW